MKSFGNNEVCLQQLTKLIAYSKFVITLIIIGTLCYCMSERVLESGRERVRACVCV